MLLKDYLQPTIKYRVIDLVQAAGIDVSDWSNFAGGAKRAASNPKYCYEWSFIQPDKVVVLNFWYANLQEYKGEIFVSINMNEEIQRLKRLTAKSIWIKRAMKLREAIALAFQNQLTVRVIINEGEMRRAVNPNAKASKVNQRALDPLPWIITSYNESSGQAVLVRGGVAVVSVDQFSIDVKNDTTSKQLTVTSKVFVRDPAVRDAALKRAKGRCEFCGHSGFTTLNGKLFLETHHIIPLADGGSDVITNVAAVCPNHHREAHYGAQSELIRDYLLRVVADTTLNKK